MGRKYYKFIIVILVAVILLLFADYNNHLLFHFSVEIFTIFIGLMMFLIAVNSKEYSNKAILLPLGIVYLYIGVLDFLHMLSFEGMGIIPTSTNLSAQYWMFARLLESAGIVFVLFIFIKGIRIKQYISHSIIVLYVLISFLLIQSDLLPKFYIEGNGQTSIKLISTFVIIVFFLVALVIIRFTNMNKQNRSLFMFVILLKIVSEVALSQYITVYSFASTIGHICKFLSYSGLYILFISEVINSPYAKLFSVFKTREEELLELAEKDSLTKIYNHSTTFSKTEIMIEKFKNESEIAIILIDIDDFKIVNDTHGHLIGDEVLFEFAQMLLTCNIEGKVIGRYGGDEFVIAVPIISKEELDRIFVFMQNKMIELNKKLNVEFTFSAGVAFYHDGDKTKDLIYKADIKMYEAKRKGKNCYVVW